MCYRSIKWLPLGPHDTLGRSGFWKVVSLDVEMAQIGFWTQNDQSMSINDWLAANNNWLEKLRNQDLGF